MRTPAEWDALWRAHLPDAAAATPDFSNEMVVGVFHGDRADTRIRLTIVSAATEGGVLRVRYREASPPA